MKKDSWIVSAKLKESDDICKQEKCVFSQGHNKIRMRTHMFCLSFSFSVFCACSFTFTISIILTIYLIAMSFTSIHSKYALCFSLLLSSSYCCFSLSFIKRNARAQNIGTDFFSFFFSNADTSSAFSFPLDKIFSLFFIQLHMLCFITLSIAFLPHT